MKLHSTEEKGFGLGLCMGFVISTKNIEYFQPYPLKACAVEGLFTSVNIVKQF